MPEVQDGLDGKEVAARLALAGQGALPWAQGASYSANTAKVLTKPYSIEKVSDALNRTISSKTS